MTGSTQGLGYGPTFSRSIGLYSAGFTKCCACVPSLPSKSSAKITVALLLLPLSRRRIKTLYQMINFASMPNLVIRPFSSDESPLHLLSCLCCDNAFSVRPLLVVFLSRLTGSSKNNRCPTRPIIGSYSGLINLELHLYTVLQIWLLFDFPGLRLWHVALAFPVGCTYYPPHRVIYSSVLQP